MSPQYNLELWLVTVSVYVEYEAWGNSLFFNSWFIFIVAINSFLFAKQA